MERLRHALSIPLISLLTVLTLAPGAHAADSTTTTEYVTIPGAADTDLRALVITPAGEGPHPLLVMPSAWSTNNLLYAGAARKLAYESGYQVVSYTARGFWDSGGEIEVAGPLDIADASAVIDWALANTAADGDRIGMAGISYGAGISLLTSAADDRVNAVGALSGWSDLVPSLYPNETINAQAAEVLLASGDLTGRPGEELREAEREYRAGNVEPVLEMAEERAPGRRVDRINANDPAVMIAHGWNDGFFPPGQLTELYSELTTPKRLMLAAGDHATREAFGAFGLPNETWEELTRWFDHHLRGVDNGVAGEAPVLVRANNGGDWTGSPSWEGVTAETTTYHLTEPERSLARWRTTGDLAAEPDHGWRHRVAAGVDTVADSGTVLLSGALQQFADIPTGVSLPLVDRDRAGVWVGDPIATATTVSGTPRARVTVTPSATESSLFAYLYAVDSYGTGSLITHKPVTLREATPGEPETVEVALDPVVWHVPAGRRLALVVDTMDPRYTSESDAGETVTFGSPDEAPSLLRVPTA